MEDATLSEILKGECHEDFVEYFVFPDLSCTGPGDEDKDNVNVEQMEQKMDEVLYALNAEAVNLMDEYLWHKDPFTLRYVPGSDHFYGLTRYGESVEDEWFVVYILQQLTLLFPKLVVRVIDNDGEFLLIEAAEFLPRWAESDSKCSRRVYLYEGKLQLIPRSEIEDETNTKSVFVGTPEVSEAVKVIREEMTMTIANDKIQKIIQDRIGKYPQKMFNNFQYANLVLPPRLVEILKRRPDLVSFAVQAFYNRDPIDIQAARLMKNFKPGDSLVKARVRFTRTLYAMLSKQDFRPDPKTGWGFPRPTSYEFKGHSLGAKLTMGFEILLATSQNPKTDSENSDSSFTSPAWRRYEEKLKKSGYYKEFLESSKPYEELRERAKTFFVTNLTNGEILHPTDSADLVVQQIKHLINTVPVDFEKLKKEGSSLPTEDDDAWLEIKADDLETLLEEQFKTKITDQKLNQIPDKLKEFMNNLSDFDGVEDPAPSLDGYFANPYPSNGDADQIDGDIELIDFRANDFVSAMDKLLVELGKPDRDWEESDDDSYFSEEDRATMEDIKKMHNFKKDSKIHQLMGAMDAELVTTEVGKTFQSNPTPSTSAASRARIEELDQFDEEMDGPDDVDLNVLSNILESFHSQDSPSGPSSNLLRSVGFDITKAKK